MEGGSAGKRSRSHAGEYDRNGESKRRNSGSGIERERERGPRQDDTVYRILCPGKKIGSVLGKGGNIIKTLRQETHAKIKVADSIQGVDERVIIIFSSGSHRSDEYDDDQESELFDGRKPLCAAQDALFRIHQRIADDDRSDEEENDDDEEKSVVVRLLVPSNQIGCLLGKGGKVIEAMRSDTGAQIKIFPKNHLPLCAMTTDELLQISGSSDVVKKALYEVSTKLHENPPKERISLSNNANLTPAASNPYLASAGQLFSPSSMTSLGPTSYVGMGSQYSSFGGYKGDAASAWSYPPMSGMTRRAGKDDVAEEFTFKLLCKSERVGGVIGKGGSTINQIRKETHANIRISDEIPDCDERVINVSSKEYPDDVSSPIMDAALELQSRASERIDEGNDGAIITRFLVPSNQIGCLLGKGGSIITDMRRRIPANIRVMPKDEHPKCATENDELVQIIGDQNIARTALIEMITRLRQNVFKDKDGGSIAGGVIPTASSFGYMSLGSGGMIPGNGYSLSSLDYTGQTAGRYSSTYGNYGSLSSGMGMYGGGYSGYSTRAGADDYGYGMSKSSSSGPLEIPVPRDTVGAILGRNGTNINHIREASGAKVKLHEARGGSDERILEISGTSDQIKKAHHLVQNYLYQGESGRSSRHY